MRFYEKYFASNYDELITYYPQFYRDVLEMRAILEAHGAVIDALEDNIERTFFNSFIDTADEQTITELERFLKIKLGGERSLETRRRLVKAFFVGFGKVSASVLAAIISSYTHGPVETKFEPFDSAGNNMLYLLYSRGDAPTLYFEDIDYLISKKIPAHIVWLALLTYRFPVGVGARRQHFWYDYDLTGTKPDIATLGAYAQAVSVTEAHGTFRTEGYHPAEARAHSGQFPTDAMIARTVRAESVTKPEVIAQTEDYGAARADGRSLAGDSPEAALTGGIRQVSVVTEPGTESAISAYDISGVLPEEAFSGHVIRKESVTEPDRENGEVEYDASGVLPEEAFAGRIVRRESASERRAQNVGAEYGQADAQTARAGVSPESAAAGLLISRESVTRPSAENAVTEIPGADGNAGNCPEAAQSAGAKAAVAGTGVRAESFRVEYGHCGEGQARS